MTETPPAVPGELIKKGAARLRSIHWDGNGCGTHGTSGCVNCFGPSPLDDREVAKEVLAAVYGDIVEAARRDALEDVRREVEGVMGRSAEWDDALDEVIAALTDIRDATVRSAP